MNFSFSMAVIVATFTFVYFQPLVKFRNHLYYEEKDHVSDAEKALRTAPGSKV